MSARPPVSFDPEIHAIKVVGIILTPLRDTVDTRGFFGEVPAELRAILINGAGIVLAQGGAPGGDDNLFPEPGFNDPHMFVKVEVPFGIPIKLRGKFT
jgi:hypothetical protein